MADAVLTPRTWKCEPCGVTQLVRQPSPLCPLCGREMQEPPAQAVKTQRIGRCCLERRRA